MIEVIVNVELRGVVMTARNLLSRAPARKQPERRAPSGNEGVWRIEGLTKYEWLLITAGFRGDFRSRRDSCARFVLQENAAPFRFANLFCLQRVWIQT